MSQIETNGMETEQVTLTPEQLKEQRATEKLESAMRGLDFLEENALFGDNFTKAIAVARLRNAESGERTEARKEYAETFESKDELRVYSSETLLAEIEVLKDIVNAIPFMVSAYNQVKKLGGTGKKRVSKKDTQIFIIGDKKYQIRLIDIAKSDSMEREEKLEFLINCPDTKEIVIQDFNVL